MHTVIILFLQRKVIASSWSIDQQCRINKHSWKWDQDDDRSADWYHVYLNLRSQKGITLNCVNENGNISGKQSTLNWKGD